MGAKHNDSALRTTWISLVQESAALPHDQRLIMYDACDDQEVRAPLGKFRKRLDARRNTKPKKPDAQRLVCTPFDPSGFNFSKIKNDRERILKVVLKGGRYDVLTNKFPLYPKHMLLVAQALVPQQMNMCHLSSVAELLAASSFCAYFNSWCASASINHFHCHLIDEMPPVTAFPLVPGPNVEGSRCMLSLGSAMYSSTTSSTRSARSSMLCGRTTSHTTCSSLLAMCTSSQNQPVGLSALSSFT